jgi:hypothetical protein
MNEGGWNLVEPEHAISPSQESEKSDDSASLSMKEVSSTGRPQVRKEASFAWRGGQERQTTGKRYACMAGRVTRCFVLKRPVRI